MAAAAAAATTDAAMAAPKIKKTEASIISER
jgi:hypothetical protein